MKVTRALWARSRTWIWVRRVAEQAVLVQGGGAQLDHGGAQFVGGFGGEGGDLVEFVLGAGGVAVHEGGGGLGGQPQGEQLLADGVVEFVGEAGAFLGDGQLAAAFVEAGVGEGDGGVLGEDAEHALVLGGEAATALRAGTVLVGEEEGADDLVAVADGQAQEVGEFGVGVRPALEAGVLAHVAEADRAALAQHRGEDAVLAGQRADGLPLGVADAVHDELGEASVVVRDAEGRVPGVEQFTGGGDDRLEDVAHLQMPAHGQQRGAHRGETGRGTWVHALTVPAWRRQASGGGTTRAGGRARTDIRVPGEFANAEKRSMTPRDIRPVPV